jgi:hypothetical protein
MNPFNSEKKAKMKTLFIGLFYLSWLPITAKPSAIIERMETRYALDKPDKLVITEFSRITILDEAGYASAVFKDYHNSFRHIRSLKYTLFDGSGKRIKKLNKSDAFDLMFNASYEIGDARMLILDPEYRIYPFTVEIEVEISYDSFLDFPVWMPRASHDLEVRSATLILEHYKGFAFRNREFNGVNPPKKTSRIKTYSSGIAEEISEITWTLHNLPAVSRQLNYKLFEINQPKVHIVPVDFAYDNKPGSFNTWKDFGDWYLYINRDRDALTTETKLYLDKLKAKNLQKDETVNVIYSYLQSKTRYISIQLGIGGYQTIPSDEVEKTGYGDCKALTNYMKAMLRYIGIESNCILVRAGSDVPDVLGDFPSNQFNHVFLGVPLEADTLLLECTSQITSPGHIGTFTDDRNVLWISQGSSKIIRAPIYTAEENVKHSKAIVSLNEEGNASIALDITQQGIYFDDIMAYKHLRTDQIEKFNYGKFDYKNFLIQSFSFDESDKSDAVLKLKYMLKINGLAKPVVGKLVLPVNILPQLDSELEIDLVNKVCDIARGFTLADEVEVRFPENYRVDFLPQIVKEVSNYGSLEITVSQDITTGYVRIKRKAMFKKGLYQKEAFEEFNQYVKKVRALDQSKIVVQSKT